MSKDARVISITNQSRTRVDTAVLTAWLEKVLRLQKIRRGQWSLTLIKDPAMKSLHARTMNDPTTTDVLTFDLRDTPSSPLELDTVICIDEARRRAKDLHHSTLHEVLLYAIHSLLHVSGHDDINPTDAAAMHRREDELLIALGIGPIYAPAPQKKSSRSRTQKRSQQ